MEVKILVPGSKSIANRALLLKTLTGNKTRLLGIPDCDDTKYMQRALKELGNKKSRIYTGNAGTATRFLTAFATLEGRKVIIDGDKRMRQRPLKALTDALNQLGANIKTTRGYLPITIYGNRPKGGKIKLPGNISSQYLSAILMIAPLLESSTTVKIEHNLYSKPYVELTLSLMRQFGFKSVNKNLAHFEVIPQELNPPKNFLIEPDASSASYIGAYAALHPTKKITLQDLTQKSIQGDIKFLKYLKKMGCRISKSGKNTKIRGPKKLKCLGTLNMNDTPDLVMTFAVLAAFADGKTKITNIANLKIKESDRLRALKNELKKLEIKVNTGTDYIEIHGRKPENLTKLHKQSLSPPNSKILIETYNDHRIAMAFGILTDIYPGLEIENPNCVSKSYTTFWEALKKLQNAN